ncbi:MAG: M12 family metallo-peptidase [Planctomycetota bacterium]
MVLLLPLPLFLVPAAGAAFDPPPPSEPARAAARVELPFPYQAVGARSARSLHLVPDPDILAELSEPRFVRFVAVPVPAAEGFDVVDLDVVRVRVTTPDSVLFVNGIPAGDRAALEDGFSAWSGVVAGEEGSDVFLAFTRSGARGWIQRGGAIAHLNPLDLPPAARPYDAVLVHERDPLLAGTDVRFTCGVDELSDPAGAGPPPAGRFEAQRSTYLREAEIAVETDYEYFQIWNDLQSAQDYALALWSAISIRFESAANARVLLPYLGLYDDPNDPWTAQGGGSGAMLDQFRNAWAGSIPGNGDLGHFMSGAGLGGGVAWVDVLCNPWWGFAVSGNINGQVSFPVPTSTWFTWDFFVCAHETGHNFGSWHTHDYCPPMDECAAGPCTAGGVCTKGTIMSYCHGCPGGMNNILTYFHERTAEIMAGRVAVAGCLDRAPCDLCDCLEPYVTASFPATVSSYDPDVQWVTLFGCNLVDVATVTVDGVAVGPEDIAIGNDGLLSYRFPRVNRLGTVDFFATNGAGSGGPSSIDVVPPASPRLGVTWWQGQEPGVSRSDGLSLVAGAAPGDLVLFCVSASPTPSVLPGFVDLDIGAGFTDLTLFASIVMGDRGWEDPAFAIPGAPLFSTWYLQGAVRLAATGAFPLVSTDMRMVVIIF